MSDNENPFFDSPRKRERHPFLSFLQTIVVATSVFIVLYLFVITPNQVDGPSMLPNFVDGQILFTNKLSQWFGDTSIGKSIGLDYNRGDVIIFQRPGDEKALIKRVVGLPGDRVAIREGYIYINNQKLIEDYLPPSTYTDGGAFIEDGGESILVEENTVFAVGDNRIVSRDSRSIGLIKREWIKGKAFVRFYPVSDFSLIRTGSYSFEPE